METAFKNIEAKKKYTHYIVPMLAKLANKPFSDPDWIFEVKWDGYRAIAELNGASVKLYSRNGLSFISQYPAVVFELRKLKLNAVLDGEIVVTDEKGKPDFQKLQQYGQHNYPIFYYVFDCLEYNGKDLKHLPLIKRKEILHDILSRNDVIRYCDHYDEDGSGFFRSVKENNLEGMVAKKKNSAYWPGKRTDNWLKIKHHNTQEAVIAGFTQPRKSREYFGALILGVYKNGKLEYIGHTGAGFTGSLLKVVYGKLQPRIMRSSPFAGKVKVNAPVTWVKPELVCQVKYSEVTKDGILRHPVFMGLRNDKEPEQVLKDELEQSGSVNKTNERKLTVNKHKITITHPDKVYWPEKGITKGDVIDYYNKVYRYIGKYLKDRPESLRRNPNGIKDAGFFQKDAGETAPSWVSNMKIAAESVDKKIDYIICNDKATLFYLNNLGCIELNPWHSRKGSIDRPDYMVMDIDPTPVTPFNEVVDVVLTINEILNEAGAKGYCKTSGGKGMHIYVPLHAAYTYDQSRSFAELIAAIAHERLRDTTTMERMLDKRNGKIYLDYLQNKKGQTLAAPYSLRPRPGATVSTPLNWREVKHGLDIHDYNITSIHKRLDKEGDIFNSVLRGKTDLKKCIRNLEKRK